jgi:two-component system, NtrC family, sensor kinase
MIYYATQDLLTSTIYTAEKTRVSEDLERFNMSLSNEMVRLSGVVGDWANWDDTYQFIQDNNTEYIQTNIVPEAFQDLDIDVQLFIDINNSLVFGKAYNSTDNNEIVTDLPKITKDYSFNVTKNDDGMNGIVLTDNGLMLISCAPILTSNYQGPAKGSVVIGSYLDDEEIGSLENITSLTANFYNSAEDYPIDVSKAEKELTPNSITVFSPLNRTRNAIYEKIFDLNQKPVALLKISTARTELAQLSESLTFLAISTVVMGIILVFSSFFLLEKFILSRLMKMSRNVEETTTKKNTLTHITLSGNDEVAHLAQKINLLIDTINESQVHLQDYANNLEKKVEDKTKQLSEAQNKLFRAERLAIIGQMASMVAHDLRSPLTAIKNASFYFHRKDNFKEDQTFQKIVGLIDEGLDNASKIVDDLLDYSRDIVLEKQNVNLKEFISNSLSFSRLVNNIHLINSVSGSIQVNVDQHKMKRVIINLVNNAVDAMPEGGEINIQSSVKEDSVQISIIDNGKGISKENLSKLWQPLFTTKSRGIGLGLVICKRFVEAHGGQLDVESVEGKGSTFKITLPMSSQ